MNTQNTAVKAIDSDIAFYTAQIKNLEKAKALLVESDEASSSDEPETKKNGLKLKAKAKKEKAEVTKFSGKVDKAAVLKAITKAERMSTGDIAKTFFDGDKETAATFLKKMGDDVSYHTRGRGGYWTAGSEEASS